MSILEKYSTVAKSYDVSLILLEIGRFIAIRKLSYKDFVELAIGILRIDYGYFAFCS